MSYRKLCPSGQWRTTLHGTLAALLLAAFGATSTVKAQSGPTTRPIERMQEQAPELPEEPAGEIPIELPPFPRAENMMELDRNRFEGGVRVFLDSEALSQPAPDVVRYTMLLVSPEGTGNLFYESINCDRDEWRSLAFGTRDGGFEAIRQPRWRTLDAGASTGHRRALARYYVCSLGRRLADRAEDLRRRLLRPGVASESEYSTRLDR